MQTCYLTLISFAFIGLFLFKSTINHQYFYIPSNVNGIAYFCYFTFSQKWTYHKIQTFARIQGFVNQKTTECSFMFNVAVIHNHPLILIVLPQFANVCFCSCGISICIIWFLMEICLLYGVLCTFMHLFCIFCTFMYFTDML